MRDELGRFIKGYPYNKGRRLSDETKKKISITRKTKGFITWLGRKHTELSKKKMSDIAKLKGLPYPQRMGIKGFLGKKHTEEWKKQAGLRQVGEKNSQWQGGITPINYKIRNSEEYKLWREAVFKRDNYTCIWCGQVRGGIEADHIKPFSLFPELRFAIDNGRTLCIECHKKTDTYGWKIKNLKRELDKFKKRT